jgi:thioredoxin-like negative regulator of GroEL
MTSHYWGTQQLNNYDIQSPEELSAIAARVHGGRMILRFHRIGCPACDSMAGVWMDMMKRPEYRAVTFVGVNVQDNPVLSKHYMIERIPTFVCIERGTPVSSFTGADVIRLKRMIETGQP